MTRQKEIVVEASTVEEARLLGAARLEISPGQAVVEILEAPSESHPLYTVLVARFSAERSLDEELASIEKRTRVTTEAAAEISADAEKRLLDETLLEVDAILDASGNVDREMLRSIKDLTVALSPALAARLDDLRLESLLEKTLGARGDGAIEIQRNFTLREAYLRFRPPMEGGRALTIEEAERTIAGLGALPPPPEELARIIERVRRPRDGHITITVKFQPGRFQLARTPDDMELLLTIHPASEHGDEVTTEQIAEDVLAEKIRFPIDIDAVRIAIATVRKTRRSVDQITVAAGRAPVDGTDAVIEWRVPMEPAAEGGFQLLEADGPITVRQGAAILRGVLATNGVSGMTLSGRPLAAKKGRAIRLDPGPGVRKISEDGAFQFIASVGGRLAIEKNLVFVRAHREFSIEVLIADDLLAAELIIVPGTEDALPVRLEDVHALLETRGVRHGVHLPLVEESVAEANRERRIVRRTIARGRPAEPGREGTIEYPFRETGGTLPLTEGRVDHRERSAVQSVRAGETVALLCPPHPGRAGRNVRDEEIAPPRLAAIRLEAGAGVRQEGNAFLAERNGHLVIRDGIARVDDFFHVRGGVDMTVGNIRHHGAVIVDGDVNDGFVVTAAGEIIIRDNLYAATIRTGETLRIGNGLIGKQKGEVEAEGDVEARFIENGTVFALGQVCVQDYILQSEIHSEKTIRIVGDASGVIGGSIVAREGIDVGNAGAVSATPTVLRTGVSPRIQREMRRLEKDFREIQNDVVRLNQIEARFTGLNPDLTAAGRERTEIYARLVRTRFSLKKRLKEIGVKRIALHNELFNVPPTEIVVRGTVHPGVRIVMGEAELQPTRKLEKVLFRYDAGRRQIMVEAMGRPS